MHTAPDIGTPTQAITFALTIGDHYDMRAFLEGWSEGDIGEWPEFKAHCLTDRPFRAGYRADSKADVFDLFVTMRRLAEPDMILAVAAVYAADLMRPRGVLRFALWIAGVRGDAGREGMLAYLHRLDPQAFLSLWEETCHHVFYSQDSEDEHSVGGWSQREIDRFIGIMAGLGLAQPTSLAAEASDREAA